jgi:hypothetical protein
MLKKIVVVLMLARCPIFQLRRNTSAATPSGDHRDRREFTGMEDVVDCKRNQYQPLRAIIKQTRRWHRINRSEALTKVGFFRRMIAQFFHTM